MTKNRSTASTATTAARTTVPLAVAAAALVLAGAGGAVAGGMITGAQIKDGTVTSADVRNGSLRPGDLTPAARSSFGRVAGYEHLRTTDLVADGETVSASLDCPAGKYLLHGSAAWNYARETPPMAVRENSTGIYGYGLSSSHAGGDFLILDVVCAPVLGRTTVKEVD